MNCLGEKELINIFLEELPRSRYLKNHFFESDAEVLTLGNGQMLFSTDEFSNEDFFRLDNPFRLGHNLAVATISDILAVCGVPYAYAHAVKVAESWDQQYVRQLARGIAAVLNQCATGFIGGDTGMAIEWGYTGICLGSSFHPLSRIGARAGDKIYMTGQVGTGNIEAAFSIYKQKKIVHLGSQLIQNFFPLRIEESKFIGQWASCCIDTSDGVFTALNTLSDLNGVGYKAENLPYPQSARLICQLLHVPKEALFLGECGEYELLFAIAPKKEEAFLKNARSANLKFTCIGEFTQSRERLLAEKDRQRNLSHFALSARDFPSRQEYLDNLFDFLQDETRP